MFFCPALEDEVIRIAGQLPNERLLCVLCYRCKRIVLAYPRTEPEGAALEVRFKDGFQHELGGSLYDPVTYRGDTQRPKFAVRFGDEYSPDGHGTVGLLSHGFP